MATIAVIEISHFCVFCFFKTTVFLFESSRYKEISRTFNRVTCSFFLEINNTLPISSLAIVQPGGKTQNVGEQCGCAGSVLQACNLETCRGECPLRFPLHSRRWGELQIKLTCDKNNRS